MGKVQSDRGTNKGGPDLVEDHWRPRRGRGTDEKMSRRSVWVEVEKEKYSKMKKQNLEKTGPISGTEKSYRSWRECGGRGRHSQFMSASSLFKIPLQ